MPHATLESTMSSVHTPSPGVVFKRLDQRMVLLRLATNQVFELNDTGARIWEMLDAGAGEDEILERLTAEFDVTADRMRQDMDTLLKELKAQGLIS